MTTTIAADFSVLQGAITTQFDRMKGHPLFRVDFSIESRVLDSAAVRSYDAKVAQANYKRPAALVTKAIIDKAKATL